MTGTVARLAVIAIVLVAAPALSRADPRDPWAGEPAARPDPPFPAERVARDPSSAARIEQARQKVLDDAYQAELPDGSSDGSGSRAAGRPGRRAGGELADRDRAARVDVRTHDEPRPLSVLMSIVMWGMFIVISVLGVAWLATELSRYGGDAELAPDLEPEARMAAVAAIIERPLEDGDELARRGEFAPAIHTLLLRTLQELARSAAVRVAPATTSREILARVPLLADARSALAGLITAVELTHFGDEPANADDYERCRRQFHMFAAAFRHRGPIPPQAVAA